MAKQTEKKPEQGREIQTIKERTIEVRTMLDRNAGEIEKALGKLLDPAQFLRICMTHYQRGGTKMLKADPRTFVAACVEAAQLGLKPDSILGECYLIPRWNKDAGSYVVNFQLGYPGVIKLVRRGGEVGEVMPEVACKNDHFQVYLGTHRRIEHEPWYVRGQSEPGEIVGAYATAKLNDGAVSFKVVPLSDLHAAAERSGDPRNKDWSNVWKDHFEAMAMKTAVLRLAKWLPMPDEMKRVLRRDEMREAGVIDADLADTLSTLVQQVHTTTTSSQGPQTLDDLVSDGPVIDAETTESEAGEDG